MNMVINLLFLFLLAYVSSYIPKCSRRNFGFRSLHILTSSHSKEKLYLSGNAILSTDLYYNNISPSDAIRRIHSSRRNESLMSIIERERLFSKDTTQNIQYSRELLNELMNVEDIGRSLELIAIIHSFYSSRNIKNFISNAEIESDITQVIIGLLLRSKSKKKLFRNILRTLDFFSANNITSSTLLTALSLACYSHLRLTIDEKSLTSDKLLSFISIETTQRLLCIIRDSLSKVWKDEHAKNLLYDFSSLIFPRSISSLLISAKTFPMRWRAVTLWTNELHQQSAFTSLTLKGESGTVYPYPPTYASIYMHNIHIYNTYNPFLSFFCRCISCRRSFIHRRYHS
jgi:hypothetical protein